MNVSFKGVIMYVDSKNLGNYHTENKALEARKTMEKYGFEKGKNIDNFTSFRTGASYVVSGQDYTDLFKDNKRGFLEKHDQTSRRIKIGVYEGNIPIINWLNNRVTQVIDVNK